MTAGRVHEKEPEERLAGAPAAAIAAPPTIAGKILALQRTAGNRAVAAVLARQPSGIPAPPATIGMDLPPSNDPRMMAMTLGPALHHELEQAQLLRTFAVSEFTDLETRSNKTGLTADQWARHAALKTDLEKLEGHIVKLKNDIAIVDNPYAEAKEVNQLLARHDAKVKIADQEIKEGKRPQVTASGVTWGSTEGTTRVDRGPDGKPVAVTKTDQTSNQVGWSDKGVTASSSQTKRIEGTKGEETVSHEEIKKRGISISGGDVSGTWEHGYKAEEGGVKKEAKLSQQLGLSGYTATLESSTQKGDQYEGTTGSASIKRGEGELGVSFTGTHKKGTMQDEKLVKGGETSFTGGAGIVADPEKGAGVAGNLGGEHKQALGKGFSASGSGSMSGRWTIKVEPVENSDPPKFRVLTVIYLGVRIGAGGGWEGDSKAAAASLGVNAGGGISASKTAVFGPVMTKAEADEYVATMKAGGAGGKYPAHKLLAKALSEGWDEAGKAFAMTTKEADPAEAKALAEGEVRERGGESGWDLKGGATPKVGGTGLGIEGGYSSTGGVNVREEGMAKGQLKLIVTVTEATNWSLGGTVTQGPAGGGGSYSQGESKKRVYTFVLDRGAKDFDLKYAQVYAAKTLEDVVKLTGTMKVTESTAEDAQSTGESAKMNLGPLGISIAGKGEVKTTETFDEHGKLKSGTYTGTSTGGGDVSFAGQKLYGDSRTEGYTGTVDASGQRTGETAVTESETDWGKTLVDTAERFEQDPLGTILGGVKLSEVAETHGTMYDEAAFKRIEAEAHPSNHAAWMSRVASPSKREEWAQTRRDVYAAAKRRDAAGVQKALAKWQGGGSLGRVEAIESIAGEGIKYDFPADLASLKKPYEELVKGDPFAEGREDHRLAWYDDAIAQYSAVKSKAESLRNSFYSNEDKFAEPLIYNEMLGRVTEVLNAAIELIQKARRDKASDKVHGDPDAPELSPDALERQELKEAGEVYENDFTRLKLAHQKIATALQQAETELDRSHSMRNYDLIFERLKTSKGQIESYEKQFRALKDTADQRGLNKSRLAPLHPVFLRGTWQEIDGRTRGEKEKPKTDPGDRLEAQLRERDMEREAEEMNQSIYERSQAAAEAKAYGEAKKVAQAKEVAAKAERASVAAAKNKAAQAAAWHNFATSKGKTVAPAAQQKAGEGWTKWALAGKQEATFKMVADSSIAIAQGVQAQASKTVALYQEAEALFNEGKALNV